MQGSLGLGGRMWKAYERQLARRPVPTQMTTSFLLWGLGDYLAQKVAEQKKVVDKRRLVITASFGACVMGPIGHYWYIGLDEACKRLAAPGTRKFLATKVIADTLILGPLYVLAFYAWGSAFIDNTGYQGFREKIVKDFIPTYAAELAIWPGFQTFNFVKVPLAHQLLAVNCMTLVDASFLSFARSQEDWVATVMQALAGKPLPAAS